MASKGFLSKHSACDGGFTLEETLYWFGWKGDLEQKASAAPDNAQYSLVAATCAEIDRRYLLRIKRDVADISAAHLSLPTGQPIAC